MLRLWLKNQGAVFKFTHIYALHPHGTYLTWGGLEFHDSSMLLGGPNALTKPVVLWAAIVGSDVVAKFHVLGDRLATLSDTPLEGVFDVSINCGQVLGTHLKEKFKLVADFRSRIVSGSRSGSLESMTGSEMASVMLNLKNHVGRLERRRYRQIVDAFHSFFPRFQIEAIEQSQGGGQPDILFYDEGKDDP